MNSRSGSRPRIGSHPVRCYRLPELWESALRDWRGHLRLQGMSEATIKVRVDHVRSIARNTDTAGPGELTTHALVAVCTARPWSAEHRKALRSSLQGFYRYCMAAGLAETDVSDALPKVRPSTPCPRPATDDIWADLLAAAAPRERLMARLAGEAGLRRAEVARAHRDDLVADGHGWSLIVHGKGGKQRVVPLTADLAATIQAHCTAGFLFPGRVDGHASVPYVGQLISKLMPAGWSIHKLRHRYATHGFAGTGNLRAVQEALGHTSVATTQRYVAVSRMDIRAVSEAAAGNGAA
jgi:integrase